MYIYSVTTHIQKSVSADWEHYMKTTHMNDVLNTGCFSKANLKKLLTDNVTKSVSYISEYFTESKENYDQYLALYATVLRQDVLNQFGSKFTAETERAFYEIVD